MKFILYFVCIILVVSSLIFPFMHSEIAIVISPVIIGELGIIVGLYKLIKVIENKNK
ncbi:hypothetical protein [Clostridium isatidis]|uniref:hypothetical protein n=1 Tax=Clostridium isatidis TaxID=182773 RepID=UPI0013E04452|nr:hypothetical protein [Clostridium isatidis]